MHIKAGEGTWLFRLAEGFHDGDFEPGILINFPGDSDEPKEDPCPTVLGSLVQGFLPGVWPHKLYPLSLPALPPHPGFMSQTPRVYVQAFLYPHPGLVRSITALRSPGVPRRPFSFMLSSCSPRFLSLLTCPCPFTTASSHGIQGGEAASFSAFLEGSCHLLFSQPVLETSQ